MSFWCRIGWHDWDKIWSVNQYYNMMGRDGLHLLYRECRTCKIKQQAHYNEFTNKIYKKEVN